ncbi:MULTISPECIES: fatty acyl-AMP ligase [Euryhalocaulis]|uniref:fatty acyl-AMP ligase n=1 Tax=Euryhalocaulis TaxID=1712422 RepID=UPI00039D9143|nr:MULTISPECIES: fatty acyl-AMP ligase [Euryhalocaulis]MBA4802206.1 fatty acyl-AMP ligase [Euryhalocaulis sp.]
MNNSTNRIDFRPAEFGVLTEGLDYAAQGDSGYSFYDGRGNLVSELPYSELRKRARAMAAQLGARFRRTERIALLAETGPQFLTAFFACQYAGLAPVPLPLPFNLGGAANFESQLAQMLDSAGASALFAPKEFGKVFESYANRDDIFTATYDELDALQGPPAPLPEITADDICYVQYSSGSTSAPKGVVSTHRNVVSNIAGIVRHGLKCGPDDRAVSWLPMYHDMGLVGFAMAPMMCQMPVSYLSTFDFVRRPLTWLRLMSETGGTISYSPTFGYDLCARRAAASDLNDLDLSSWRIAGIGGDMVRSEVLDRFAEAFEANGFSATAFMPSYGLAESTVAVSFADMSRAPAVDMIDLPRFIATGEAATAAANAQGGVRRFVSCGHAMPGHSIEIRTPSGRRAEQRQVGHIFTRGPSVCRGYFGDPDATARLIDAEGWMDTGDMGYLANDELFVTGRSKDLILYHGRNIWPQDIEWAVEKLPAVRPGSVAAFSIEDHEGDERIVTVVAAGSRSDEEREELTQRARAAVQAVVGVPAEVVVAPAKAMVLTSSGKLSRAKVKARYLAGAFETAAPPRSVAYASSAE